MSRFLLSENVEVYDIDGSRFHWNTRAELNDYLRLKKIKPILEARFVGFNLQMYATKVYIFDDTTRKRWDGQVVEPVVKSENISK